MEALRCLQWEEWGNPHQEEYYHYMKSYAPVDNIEAGKKYPNILATGGLHDPRVACAWRSPMLRLLGLWTVYTIMRRRVWLHRTPSRAAMAAECNCLNAHFTFLCVRS